MLFDLESFRTLIHTLPYSFLLPLFGAIVGGEGIIIFFSTLAAAGVLPFWVVVSGSYAGTMLADSFWFWFGGHFFNWLKSKERISKSLATVTRFSDTIMRGRYFYTLVITKFLYGARILTISYFSHKGLPFWRFTLYNVFATGFLTLIVCNIGWWIGRGIVQENTLKNLRLAVLIIIIVVTLLHFLRLQIYKTFFNKTE
jgi:membrane protein DedA with SNARE-associated domain